jgi:hypothetical protein
VTGIEPPPLRASLEYLWGYFCEVALGIQPNGMTAPIIAWGDLTSWQRETGVRLAHWEKLVLVSLASARARIHGEALAKEQKR